MLERLSSDLALLASQAVMFLDGMADLLRTALTERGGAVNALPAAVVARSAIEVAAQVHWLGRVDIAPEERCRRYLTFLFDDLKQLRKVMGTGPAVGEEQALVEMHALGVAQIDEIEAGLLVCVERAGWAAKAQFIKDDLNVEPAALLEPGQERSVRFPSYSTLVTEMVGTPLIYGLLSAPAHGQLYSVVLAIDSDPHTGRERTSGSSIPAEVLVEWACTAALMAVGTVAAWNGVNAEKLIQLGHPLGGLWT